MAKMLEVEFIPLVAEGLRELGYKATQEPTRIPNRSAWRDNLSTLVGGTRYRPDILVENGDKFALVETKTKPVLTGSVIQAQRYAEHFDAKVVLCVPDDVFPQTPKSVKNFAQDNGIRLCPQSEVGTALREILD